MASLVGEENRLAAPLRGDFIGVTALRGLRVESLAVSARPGLPGLLVGTGCFRGLLAAFAGLHSISSRSSVELIFKGTCFVFSKRLVFGLVRIDCREAGLGHGDLPFTGLQRRSSRASMLIVIPLIGLFHSFAGTCFNGLLALFAKSNRLVFGLVRMDFRVGLGHEDLDLTGLHRRSSSASMLNPFTGLFDNLPGLCLALKGLFVLTGLFVLRGLAMDFRVRRGD